MPEGKGSVGASLITSGHHFLSLYHGLNCFVLLQNMQAGATSLSLLTYQQFATPQHSSENPSNPSCLICPVHTLKPLPRLCPTSPTLCRGPQSQPKIVPCHPVPGRSPQDGALPTHHPECNSGQPQSASKEAPHHPEPGSKPWAARKPLQRSDVFQWSVSTHQCAHSSRARPHRHPWQRPAPQTSELVAVTVGPLPWGLGHLITVPAAAGT